MHIFTVKDLVDSLKITLEETFPFIMVKGEVSRVKSSATGHVFFELKDDEASIACVCWKEKLPKLTNFPQEGREVTIKGYLTAFKNGAKLHLIVIDIEEAGLAKLMAELEARKTRLAAAGYFDEKHKKVLPLTPKIIGVITSPTGSVIEDIKIQIKNRYPTKILLYPAMVQGSKLVTDITNGLAFFNGLPPNRQPNVIIIARGGGSFEDLWHFNDETLVKAVFNSKIPVVSAVGHETDVTLIDFVADKRASTPTQAAELVTPMAIKDLASNFQETYNYLTYIVTRKINNHINYLNQLSTQILSLLKLKLNTKLLQFKGLDAVLESLSIQNTLKRGFTLLKSENHQLIKRVKDFKNTFEIVFFDGSIKIVHAEVEED